MSLTPTQLSELQTIVLDLGDNLPDSSDALWDAAIRIQKAGLGPVTGPGGQPAFDAAVADIVLTADQIATVQGRQGGPGNSVQQATFSVVPVEDNLPAGALGDVIYLSALPNTYAGTSVISLTPAGPNSVQLDEVGTTVARTVPAASGGLEVNNLATGAGFERVLTTSDGGGGTGDVVGPAGATDEAIARYNTATGKLIQNSLVTISDTGDIQGPDGMTINPTGELNLGGNDTVKLYDSGLTNPRISTSSSGGSFQGTGGNPNLGQNVTIQLGFASDGGVGFPAGAIGWGVGGADTVLRLRNQVHGGPIVLDAENAGGTLRTLLTADPDTETIITAAGLGALATASHGMSLFGEGAGGVTNTRIEFLDALPGGTRNFVIGALGLNQSNILDELLNRPTRIAGTSGSGIENYMIGTPNGDTLLQGNTGVRIQTGSGVVDIRTPSLRFSFNSAGQLNLLGNGTQSGVLNVTEGTSAFGSVAGEGQFWVRDDVPCVPMFTDDAGTDFVLNGGGGGSPFATPLEILADIPVADPPTTETPTGLLTFRDSDDTTTLATIGFNAANTLLIRNFFRTGATPNLQIAVDDGSGAIGANIIFDGGTNGDIEINGEGDVLISVNGGTENAISCLQNAEVRLYHNNVQAARTLVAASGGLEANNLATGAGFERVLTTSDLGGVTGVQQLEDPTGDIRLVAENGGIIALRSDGNTDTEVRRIDFNHQDSTLRGFIGHNASSTLTIDNRIDGGSVFIQARDAGSVTRNIMNADPDGITSLRGDTDIQLLLGPTPETALTGTIGGAVGLYYNDAENARTNILGLEVRDTLYVGFLPAGSGVIKLGEQANADADEAGYGQLWVRSDAFSNTLMFTNDNGNDFIVAGLPDSDESTGAVLIAGTTFVAAVNVAPKINQSYMFIAHVEVTAPAADDMNIQMTMDTNTRIYATVTNSNDNTTQVMEGQVGEVVTNNVLIPTDGSATPNGTYVEIMGRMVVGATSGTHSIRFAKNADTGADGFAVRCMIKLFPMI